MTNTLENKAKFFAQYWGQEEIGSDKYSHIMPDTWNEFPSFIGDQYLILTPLSQMSDEDAIESANILSAWYSNTNESAYYDLVGFSCYLQEVFLDGIGGIAINNTQSYGAVIDYLRSKGYALPWMGISVEKLVEWGWVKLRGGENG